MYKFVLAICFLINILDNKISNIYDYVFNHYGEDQKKMVREYYNVKRKYEKSVLDLAFLMKCKVYNIFPKFLRFKLYRRTLQSSTFYRSWQTKLLNNEIKLKKKSRDDLQIRTSELSENVKNSVSAIDNAVINIRINRLLKRFIEDTSTTHQNKLRNLGINNDLKPYNPDAVVFNYSSHNLTHRMKSLLAFGLDFCLPVYKINFYEYFLAFESLFNRIRSRQEYSNINKDEFINKYYSLANRYFYNFKSQKVFSAFHTKQCLEDLKALGRKRDIIISKPDKGKGVVIIDRAKYIEKMTAIISDPSKFEPISATIQKYTTQIEDKVNNFLQKLKNITTVPAQEIAKLRASGSAPGILYGLPKIHKRDFTTQFQFRPIFAAYNNPCYKLAKFLVSQLTPISTNEFTVRNVYSFLDDLKQFDNANQYFMCSFDIESLYTNIPLVETINIILDKLFTFPNSKFLGLNRTWFKKLLDLSVLNSFFIFNEKLYKQKEGLAMGLPHSATFANIFLCHHEQQWLLDCPTNFKPIFYRRYMDDTFVLFRDRIHADMFLQFLNSRHPNMIFTCETQKDNQISFLDAHLCNSNNAFKSSVFRKSSFSGLGTSFFSFCAFKFKLNSIQTLIYRAYHVCSTFQSLDIEFQFIKTYFNNNGFPAKIVDSCINRFLCKQYDRDSPSIATVSRDQLYFCLPYVGFHSEKLKRDLNSLLGQYLPSIAFNPILVNKFKTGSFFNYKDRLPKAARSSVIYKFRCEQCSSEYVGSTTRSLHTRASEHAGRSSRTNNRLACPPNSSIRDHAETCGSPITINQFSILSSCKTEIDLRILESLYIFKQKPSINNVQSSYPLAIVNR